MDRSFTEGSLCSSEHDLGTTRQDEAETTIFVTTIGDEPHFRKCIEHLRSQSINRPVEIIDRVGPLSAAFSK